jgi:pimeloyl-ACP methyl ester carboxylesterase
MAVEPFEIRVGREVLDDLRSRLERTRWADVTRKGGTATIGPEAGAWAAGTSATYLRDLVSYWRDGYDWRYHEARLNELPQFKARVGQAELHFVHARARGQADDQAHGQRHPALLLLHGWPDSFYRFHKVIPAFCDPAGGDRGGDPGDAFDVVVPSLPGFAFTGPLPLGPHQPTRQSAELLWRLMTEVLGYQRFAVAGGDGGSALAQILAIDHPDSVVGIHLTDLGWHVANVDPAPLPRAVRKYLQALKKRFLADGAYAMVQMTYPRTLAPALTDSPAGLASWIVDRFHSWSEASVAGGDLDASFSKDELLTNIMLYWVTGTIGSSIANYWAEARSPSLSPADRVAVPVGLALYPRDIGGIPPRSFAKRTLSVVRWTEMARGGHFAALEAPDTFVRDVVAFFRPLRPLMAVAGGGQTRRQEEPGDAHPAV